MVLKKSFTKPSYQFVMKTYQLAILSNLVSVLVLLRCSMYCLGYFCTLVKYHSHCKHKSWVDQSSILPAHLGIGIHSLILSKPAIQPTSRSKPIPNPACGAPPNFLRSKYHWYSEPCRSSSPANNPASRIFRSKTSDRSSLTLPPINSPTWGTIRSKQATVLPPSPSLERM